MIEAARNQEHTATEVLVRAMEEFGEEVDRVVVLALDKSGQTISMYSNARSEAEMHGIMWLRLKAGTGIQQEDL